MKHIPIRNIQKSLDTRHYEDDVCWTVLGDAMVFEKKRDLWITALYLHKGFC